MPLTRDRHSRQPGPRGALRAARAWPPAAPLEGVIADPPWRALHDGVMVVFDERVLFKGHPGKGESRR